MKNVWQYNAAKCATPKNQVLCLKVTKLPYFFHSFFKKPSFCVMNELHRPLNFARHKVKFNNRTRLRSIDHNYSIQRKVPTCWTAERHVTDMLSVRMRIRARFRLKSCNVLHSRLPRSPRRRIFATFFASWELVWWVESQQALDGFCLYKMRCFRIWFIFNPKPACRDCIPWRSEGMMNGGQ